MYLGLRIFFIVLLVIARYSLHSQTLDRSKRLKLKPEMDMPLYPETPKNYFKINPKELNPYYKDSIRHELNLGSLTPDYNRKKFINDMILPGALIAGGVATVLPEQHCILSKCEIQRNELQLFDGRTTRVDDYLQFAPLVSIFALKAAGVKSKSDFVNQLVITTKAELLMNVIVKTMKKTIPSERPDGSSHNSMPSGHTAQAFMAATILDHEYRDTSPWIRYGGYAMATATGVGRMMNDRHWISDVLVGAAVGMISTNVVYLTHQYRWGKSKSNMVVLPTLVNKGGGVALALTL